MKWNGLNESGVRGIGVQKLKDVLGYNSAGMALVQVRMGMWLGYMDGIGLGCVVCRIYFFMEVGGGGCGWRVEFR